MENNTPLTTMICIACKASVPIPPVGYPAPCPKCHGRAFTYSAVPLHSNTSTTNRQALYDALATARRQLAEEERAQTIATGCDLRFAIREAEHYRNLIARLEARVAVFKTKERE